MIKFAAIHSRFFIYFPEVPMTRGVLDHFHIRKIWAMPNDLRHVSWLAVALMGCSQPRSPEQGQSRNGSSTVIPFQRTLEMEPPASLLPLDRPLQEDELLTAVISRNPTLIAMQASWLAARARYPQAAAIPEPTLSYAVAPWSLRESTPGMDVSLSQPIPWSQKLHGRGDAARAEADEAAANVVGSRLQLIAETKFAFADYWLASGELVVNRHQRDLVDQINSAAISAYGVGQGTRAAALRAQSMLNELDHHAILLNHARNIAIARLNLLLHRPSEEAVPPPPPMLPDPVNVPDIPLLSRLANDRRPELASASARRRKAMAMNRAIGAQDLPDVSITVGYSSMWTDPTMRFTVGVSVPLPINRGQRTAARDEVQADMQRADADLAAISDRIQFEVREAHERLLESWHIVHLLRERMIPTAVEQVSTAQGAITSGGHDYAALLTAQSELVDMQWQEQQALADFHHRLADLERIVGGPMASIQGSSQEQP